MARVTGIRVGDKYIEVDDSKVVYVYTEVETGDDAICDPVLASFKFTHEGLLIDIVNPETGEVIGESAQMHNDLLYDGFSSFLIGLKE